MLVFELRRERYRGAFVVWTEEKAWEGLNGLVPEVSVGSEAM